jgi:hypothetical protein
MIVIDVVQEDVSFRKELESLLNRFSRENRSNTPDFILANYLEATTQPVRSRRCSKGKMVWKNENQAERLVNAFEKIAEALTRRATLDADRFAIEHPPRREPKDVTITKPKDDEDRLREDQGSTDEPLDEWTGRREKELIDQGS